MRTLTAAVLAALLAACGGGDEMPVPKPCAMWPVVVSAGVNDKIDVLVGATEYHATIAPATYYSPALLGAAVKTALDAAYAPVRVLAVASSVNNLTPFYRNGGTHSGSIAPGVYTGQTLQDAILVQLQASGAGWTPHWVGSKMAFSNSIHTWYPRTQLVWSVWQSAGFTFNYSSEAADIIADTDPAYTGSGAAEWSVTVSSGGRLNIDIGSGMPFRLLFSTGANAATSARDVLGFGAIDTPSATSATGANQMQQTWFPGECVADDTGDLDFHQRAQAVALGGPVKSLHFGTVIRREVRFDFLPAWKVFQASEGSTYLNESFQRLLASGWARLRWFNDATDLATGTDYVLDLDTAKQLERDRVSAGTALYGLRLKLRKYV
jgi:hypothetical protein